MADKKDEFLIARIPGELKDALKKRAKDMGLNLSELVRRMSEKFLKK